MTSGDLDVAIQRCIEEHTREGEISQDAGQAVTRAVLAFAEVRARHASCCRGTDCSEVHLGHPLG